MSFVELKYPNIERYSITQQLLHLLNMGKTSSLQGDKWDNHTSSIGFVIIISPKHRSREIGPKVYIV